VLHGAFLRWPPWQAAGWWLDNPPEECATSLFPHQSGHHLMQVHSDYIQMFEETRRLLPSDRPEAGSSDYISQLKKPAEYLRQSRSQLEPVRRKLMALGTTMRGETLEPDVADFIKSLLDYFYQWLPGPGSASIDLLARIEDSIERGHTSSEELSQEYDSIVSYIDSLLERKREGWSRVCEAFVPLMLRAAKSKVP
jgi:hypothetical protein